MVELRWLTRKKLVTADMVREYAIQHNISSMTAKRELELTSSHQLQYRQIIDKTMRGDNTVVYQTPFPQVPPIIGTWEWTEWKDVNHVTEIIE